MLPEANFLFPWCQSPSSRAQKCQFCARKAGKWRFQTQKAHKNPDFVLERAENEGSEGKKRTKTSISCSKSPKTGVPKAKSAQKPRFCARKRRKRGAEAKKKHKNAVFVLGPQVGPQVGTHVGTQVGPQFAAELVLGVSLQLSWFLGLVCR